MTKLIGKKILAFGQNESGATAIEYSLIAGFIALIIVVALRSIGTNLNNKFSGVNAGLV